MIVPGIIDEDAILLLLEGNVVGGEACFDLLQSFLGWDGDDVAV